MLPHTITIGRKEDSSGRRIGLDLAERALAAVPTCRCLPRSAPARAQLGETDSALEWLVARPDNCAG